MRHLLECITPLPVLPALGLLALLAGCAAPVPPPWRDSPEAVSRVHAAGLPHTDQLGRPRRQLDPVRSFFPLVLDNAMVEYGRGLRFGFATAYEAGFNAIAPWNGQPLDAVLQAAAGSRLLAVLPPAQAAAARADETADTEALFDARAVRLVRIEPFREQPQPRDPPQPLDGDTGLALLRKAVAQTPETPVWAVLQAYATPGGAVAGDRRRLPSSAEARALAYGAVIEGASGLVWFGEDSYAARSLGALGIGPTLPLDYGVILPENQPSGSVFKPDPAQVGQARALWQAVARLNREIERLSPALLGGISGLPPRAELLPLDDGPPLTPDETPIRLRLLHYDGHLTLLAVNLSPRPWRLRLTLLAGIKRLERWFDPAPPPALNLANRQFEEDFQPFGVRIYRFTP